MRTARIAGGGGLELHSVSAGNPDGAAILFIHGFSQSWLCWRPQFESALAGRHRLVAFDLRGHGGSDKPHDPMAYIDSNAYAEDVAAVIRHWELENPLLVGWSYAGTVICAYVEAFGDAGIAGCNFVGAAFKRGLKEHLAFYEPYSRKAIQGMCTDDPAENIRWTREFLQLCTAQPLPAHAFEEALAYNMLCPAHVRRAVQRRIIDYDRVLERMSVPVLFSHGRDERLVRPAMSEHACALVRDGTVSYYDGVGHAPFVEAPERFNRELAGFAERCFSG